MAQMFCIRERRPETTCVSCKTQRDAIQIDFFATIVTFKIVLKR